LFIYPIYEPNAGSDLKKKKKNILIIIDRIIIDKKNALNVLITFKEFIYFNYNLKP